MAEVWMLNTVLDGRQLVGEGNATLGLPLVYEEASNRAISLSLKRLCNVSLVLMQCLA